MCFLKGSRLSLLPERAVMMRVCSAFNCSKKQHNKSNLSFHSFPKDKALREKWITATKQLDIIPSNSYLCSKHFNKDDFVTDRSGRSTLKKNTVPSVSLHFNSTTTEYNIQNPADSEAIEGTMKIEIEEHPIYVKPELDLMPTFDRHYFVLPEDRTMDVDLHSATTSVPLKSDPFTALPSVDTERVDEAMTSQHFNSNGIVVKMESDVIEDCGNIREEANIPVYTSILEQEKPKISADTNICHIEGDAALSRNDNDPEAGPSQNLDPLNQSLLHPRGFPFSCNVCTYKGTSSRNLAQHKRRHFSKKKLQCSQCDFRAHWKGDLVRHLSIHSEKRSYACVICTYRGATSSHLAHHKLRHTNEKKFQCSQCDFRTHQKCNLVAHLRIHSGERPYACDICTYRCAQSSNLNPHKLRHLLEKKFQCSQCDYRANEKSTLVVHLRTHSGEQPYACDVCEYKCKSTSALGHHKNTHSSVKNYKCDKCNFASCRRGNLSVHQKIHSGLKPYQCDKCNYASVRRSDLTLHQKIHSGLKPYQCDKCTYSCARKDNLTRHKKTHK